MTGDYTLEDFRRELGRLRRQGGLTPPPEGIPGGTSRGPSLESIERMIDAMTAEERGNPAAIDEARRQRIASASGVTGADVGKFLDQFEGLRALMRRMAEMRLWDT